MKLKAILILLIASVIFVVGCVTKPIYNVENAPVTVASNTSYTLDDIKKAIIRAGVGLGWQMKEVSPGQILATLNIRTHMAQVTIDYNLQTYSITYKDSTNQNYDGTNIHGNYNGWIQNLDNAIKGQLSAI